MSTRHPSHSSLEGRRSELVLPEHYDQRTVQTPPSKGNYISVGTTELYQSEELYQAAIYCLIFIRADAIQQLRCHPEE